MPGELADYSQALASFLKDSGNYKEPRPPTGSLAGNRPAHAHEGRKDDAIDALDMAMAGVADNWAGAAAMTALVYATEWDDAATANHAKVVIAARAGTELLDLFKRAGEADD